MIKKLLLAVVITGLALTVSLHAKIYKTVDEDGNTIFTDAPSAPEDGEAVILKPFTPVEFKAPKPLSTPEQQDQEEETTAASAYEQLTITKPEDGATLRGNGDITIKVKHTPALHKNHQLALFINGQPVGTPQTNPVFELKNVSRGEINLQVSIIDASGNTVETAQSTVFVFRPMIRRNLDNIPIPRPTPMQTPGS